jgi:tetratricopeptide (TPR) repeat protein
MALGGLCQGSAMLTAQITVQAVAGVRNLGAAAASAQLSRSLGSAFGAATAGAVLFGVLAAMDQLDQAAECYRCVLELQPGNAAALSNYGHVLARRDELDAAIASFRQAIAIQPAHAEAHVNLGNALLDQGKPHEAEASYATALRIDPMNTNTHWCRGLALLTAGNLAEGFAEWRWKPETMTRFPTPEWRGEDLNGKHIFIHAEQGFGDTIQFARYLAMIAAKGGRIILEAPAELHRLFADPQMVKAGAAELADGVQAFA